MLKKLIRCFRIVQKRSAKKFQDENGYFCLNIVKDWKEIIRRAVCLCWHRLDRRIAYMKRTVISYFAQDTSQQQPQTSSARNVNPGWYVRVRVCGMLSQIEYLIIFEHRTLAHFGSVDHRLCRIQNRVFYYYKYIRSRRSNISHDNNDFTSII